MTCDGLAGLDSPLFQGSPLPLAPPPVPRPFPAGCGSRCLHPAGPSPGDALPILHVRAASPRSLPARCPDGRGGVTSVRPRPALPSAPGARAFVTHRDPPLRDGPASPRFCTLLTTSSALAQVTLRAPVLCGLFRSSWPSGRSARWRCHGSPVWR